MGHTKLIITGDIAEQYDFTKEINTNIRRRRPHRNDRRVGESYRRRIDNQFKTRRAFLRIVNVNLQRNDSPALLSVTFAEPILFRRGVRLWGEYIRLLRVKTGWTLDYVVVPEFQKRGVLHFHALIWGIPTSYIQNERMERTLQNLWARGFLDIKSTDRSPKLGGYLAKYMLKALQDFRLCQEKAYYTSRGIMRPVLLNTKTQVAFTRRALSITGDNLVFSKKFDTMWLGECTYSRYKIK